MKKWSIIIGFCLLLSAAGCSKDMANRDVYEESGDTINVNNKREELYNEGGSQGVRNVSDNYGFVRHQKSPIHERSWTAMDHYSAINREQVANIISQFQHRYSKCK